MKYLIILIWLELIIVFATGCSSPREKRGDWMENLSGRTYEPINWWSRRSPWYRNYKTTEEIQEDWHRVYNKTIEDLDKRISELENEDIY
tara:strand:+ start:154 stop:423 length:270 start_codon:yes stop_codon:yes gene_type:complete